MPLRVGVLGPVCAWRAITGGGADGGTEQELVLGQPRQLAVLGVLAVRANLVVSRAELIDAVWGEQPPATAEGSVYTYIAGLRRVLEPGRPRRHPDASRREPAQVLVSAGGGYMLRMPPEGLDAVAFEHGWSRFRALRASGDLPAAEKALTGALALWRGEAFAGVPGPFAEAERMRLGELRTAAAEDRGDLLLARGRHVQAVADLTALVSEYPLRERARALLMIALYRSGRQAEALQVFHDARVRLADDLGIDPGPELAQVHQQVLTMSPALDSPAGAEKPVTLSAPAAMRAPVLLSAPVAVPTVPSPAFPQAPLAAPVPTMAPPDQSEGHHADGPRPEAARGDAMPAPPIPAQVPHEVAGFAGRSAELSMLRGLLGGLPSCDPGTASGGSARTPGQGPGVPVVVISGSAGVGKTALAIRFAREAAAQFPDGQLYVNLRGFDPSGAPADPSATLRGFLGALGVPSGDVPATLEAQSALFRSLLGGKRMLLLLDNARTTSQVRPLLPGSPGCMVVVTSRDQLAGLVAAEGARLVPLDVMSEDEARELLAARLGADRIAAEPAAVTELIRQSARLPLALSVATARAVTRPGISLAGLSGELRDARVRLDALDAEDVATDLRAVFSWSLAWLSEQAARMFRLLGVVPGPDVSVAVAASLAGIPFGAARSALAELSRASLLTEDVQGRFSCHDLLRAYAAERARTVDGDAGIEAAQRRLLDHYLRTAHAAASSLYPARTRIGLPPAIEGVTPERLDTYEDVLRWFQAEQKSLMAAVALAGDRGAGRESRFGGDGGDQGLDIYSWQLAWSCAPTMMRLGQWVEIAAGLRTGLSSAERLGDPLGKSLVHYELGWACCCLGEFSEADGNLRRALELATACGDEAAAAYAHHGLVLLFDRQGRYAEALPHAHEALRLRSASGDRAAAAYAENTVGWIYANLGQHAEALRHCKRALDLHLESGSRSGVADTLDSIAFAFQGLGDHEQAIAHYQQAVVIFREIGDPRGEVGALAGLGDAQLAVGQRDDAQRSWERALSLATRMTGGDSTPIRDRLALLN